jgi:transcriptional regulator with XRE-family HTH domain
MSENPVAIAPSDRPSPGRTPGERLRSLRQKAGIKSAADAARRLKMPQATYYQHESGHHALTTKQAEAYAEFYGVPAAVILYGDDAVFYPEAVPQPQRTSIIGQVNRLGLVERFSRPQWLPTLRGASGAPLDAVVIATDELEPVYYRGDHVLFTPLTRPLRPSEVDGREVVLTLDRARMMLATLASQSGAWIIKVPHQPAIAGRRVYLASRVAWIKRA